MSDIGDFDNSKMTLSYSGFGRDVSITLNGEDADYLPKVMVAFAEFCRAVGFCWVAVDQVEGESLKGFKTKNYLFRGNYQWDDDTSWADNDYTKEDWWDVFETEQQDAVNKAAEDYWDKTVDKAVDDEQINAGDTVFYHGRGAGETTLNELEQPQGHGGHKGVSLVNMKGVVKMVTSSPVGPRVLVKWNNWNDGHNGMGDDPNAVMSDKSYWWSNVDNVAKSN